MVPHVVGTAAEGEAYVGRSAVHLMDSLLEACQRDRALYSILLKWPGGLRSRSKQLAERLRDAPMARLDGATIQIVVTFMEEVRETYPHFTDGVVCRTVLDAFDLLLGEQLIDLFALEAESWEYAPDSGDGGTNLRIVYTPQPDLRMALKEKPISSRRSRQDGREATCLYFRRVDSSNHRCMVTLSHRSRPELEKWLSADSLPRIASCHRQVSLSDYYVWIDEDSGVFGPVSPVQEQSSDVVTMLEIAQRANCTVVLLPELSVSEDDEARIARWFEDQDIVRMIVAGSRHIDHDDGARENRSAIFLKGEEGPLVHRKLVPFVYRYEDLELVEDIEPGTELAILSSRHFTVAVVICADLLEPIVGRTLEDFGVNFLLVPAMSPVLGLFEVQIDHLVGENVGFVLLANGPAEWGRSYHAGRAVRGRAADAHDRRVFRDDSTGLGVQVVSSGLAETEWLVG
jgi:hypothetical protein